MDDHQLFGLAARPVHRERGAPPGQQRRVTRLHGVFNIVGVVVVTADDDEVLAAPGDEKLPGPEEAQIAGGLGGAVAELLGEEFPVPMKRLGVRDRYGESGKPEELFNLHGLTPKHITLAAHHIVDKK